MRHFSAGTRHLFLKALILSVCFHLLIGRIFIFTFPLKKVSLKPAFVFWGSILPQHDFSFSSYPNNTIKMKLQKPNLIEKPTSQKLKRTLVQKPAFQVTSIDQKNQYKTEIDEFAFELKAQTDPLGSLGIESTAPPRKPLKLTPNDQN